MHDDKEIARFEALAEEAYSAMYEAQPHGVKDLKDDALSYLSRAIDLAGACGLAEEVVRLSDRRDQIMAVYDHQFRGVR